jgi:hypothetical protein
MSERVNRAGSNGVRRWEVEVTFVVEAKSAEDAEQQVLDAIDGGSSTLSSYYGVITAEGE